jgi:hypothetical protein
MKKYDWNKFVPWFLTISCTLTLIVIGVFLIKNIEWYKESVFAKEVSEIQQPEYRFYAYHLHLSMIKRSIGLFSGFAIMFLGLGVAFFTLKNNSTVDASGAGFSAKIVTASPGIIALLVGAYLIISTIDSKDNFPNYEKKDRTEDVLDKSKKPKAPTDL